MAQIIDVKNKIIDIDFKSRMYAEGLNFSEQGFYPNQDFFNGAGTNDPSVNGGSGGSYSTSSFNQRVVFNYNIPVSKAFYLDYVHLWASRSCLMAAGGIRGIRNIGGPFKPVGPNGETVTVQRLFQPGMSINASLYGILGTFDVSTNKVAAMVGFSGTLVSSDLNFDSIKVASFIGDSNMVGQFFGTAPNVTQETLWTAKVITYLRSKGVDIRRVDKAQSGDSSITYEGRRVNGELTIPQTDLVIYNLGTNDTVPATYLANLTAFVNWHLQNYPKAKIIVISPIPGQGSYTVGGSTVVRETIYSQMRTAAQNFVNGLNNPNVLYINGYNAFDINDNSQYSDTESNGSHIHIGVKGHQSLANYVISNITDQFLKSI